MKSKKILKPSFLIIGGVKCASSSLYRYLNDHPQVLPCRVKEPGYFNFTNPLVLLKKYRSYINKFPDLNQAKAIGDWIELEGDGTLSESKFEKLIHPDVDYITGEATATTMVRANPKIVKRIFPNIKIIALVRNPTDRLISHYQMFKRFDEDGRKGNDVGSLQEFINRELENLDAGKRTKALEQGFYTNYLSRWQQSFGDSLTVISSDSLQGATSNSTLNWLAKSLEIDNHDFSQITQQRFNQNRTAMTVEPSLRVQLDEIYHPFNEELLDAYGIDFLTDRN